MRRIAVIGTGVSILTPLLLALLMLGLILIPGSIWHHPLSDEIYRGFNPYTQYVDLQGDGYSKGVIQVSEQRVRISAPRLAAPTMNLATTPLLRLTASVDVVILDNPPGSSPLRIGLWSPVTKSGYFIVFGEGPSSLVVADTIVDGAVGHTLLGSNEISQRVLGRYLLRQPYHLRIAMQKDRHTIATTISGAGIVTQATVTDAEASTLFESVRVSLTVSASSSTGTSAALLQGYSLELPHERFFADKAEDSKVTLTLVLLGGLGAIAVVLALLKQLSHKSIESIRLTLGSRVRESIRVLRRRQRLMLFTVVLAGAYIVPNAILFALGGHPFDMADEKLYAYVAAKFGLAHLYYLPNVVSLPAAWGGVPYQEAAFPYEPVLGYFFGGVGWVATLLQGGVSPNSTSLEYLIKAGNATFGLADAVLIYLILRQLKVSQRWSLIGSALFLFNPAVWFSMSVWGQTHVISLFFALAAMFLGEKGRSTTAWIFLAAAALTRPQMLVLGVLLGTVFLRKFSITQNLRALSWTVITIFMLMLPFMLRTSPSLLIDVMGNTLRIQEGGGNDPTLTTVSQDAYSIWPLVTYAAHGTSGLYRSFTPSAGGLIGGVSYQRVGQILTIGTLLVLAGLLLLQRRWTRSPGEYIPLVALGMVSFLMFTTGLVATHFVLAVPFLLLCRKWLTTSAYFFIVIAWTVTTLVPMYGDMGNVISHLNYPLLGPSNNFVTAFFVQLYSWDRFITLGTLANLGALIWLAVTAVRQASRSEHALAPAAVS